MVILLVLDVTFHLTHIDKREDCQLSRGGRKKSLLTDKTKPPYNGFLMTEFLSRRTNKDPDETPGVKEEKR